MAEKKIETILKSWRLPVDVVEALDRWATETNQPVPHVLANCVRAATEDEKRIISPPVEKRAKGAPAPPKNRDELADAMTALMDDCRDHVGVNDLISALGIVRSRVYRATPEYQAQETVRNAKGYSSVYADEKALAEALSNGQRPQPATGIPLSKPKDRV